MVGLVGQKMVVGISNSFYAVFGPLLAPIPNFIKIRWKTQKLKVFTICRFWLVELVGRKNTCRHFKLIQCCFYPIISLHTKFHQNRMKNTEVVNFHFWSILVGLSTLNSGSISSHHHLGWNWPNPAYSFPNLTHLRPDVTHKKNSQNLIANIFREKWLSKDANWRKKSGCHPWKHGYLGIWPQKWWN